MFYKLISQNESVFHEKISPENGFLEGYSSLINDFDLQVPIPEKISLISEKHNKYSTDNWNIFTPRHAPKDSLYGHLAFGFVFIHPFLDGNGRIHRYIIHYVLARMDFTSNNFIFPVSSAILERIDEYRDVLTAYSYPCLDLIKWETTKDNINHRRKL